MDDMTDEQEHMGSQAESGNEIPSEIHNGRDSPNQTNTNEDGHDDHDDIDGKVEILLNEIQRLRNVKLASRMPPAVAPSIHHQSSLTRQLSSPRVVDRVRAQRTLRSFPHHHGHGESQVRSLDAIIGEGQPRRASEVTLSRTFLEQLAKQSSEKRVSADDTALSTHESNLRFRRTKIQSGDARAFSVVVSAPVAQAISQNTRTDDPSHLRSRTLSLTIPDYDELQHEQHPDEHLKVLSPSASQQQTPQQQHAQYVEPPSPLSPFKHNRRPSMSERLNAGGLLARSPAHHVARSIVAPTDTTAENHRRHDTTHLQAPEEGDEGRPSTVASDEESDTSSPAEELSYPLHRTESTAESRMGNLPELPMTMFFGENMQPERVHESIFDGHPGDVSIHPHDDTVQEHRDITPEPAESLTPAQLASAIASAASTVNMSQDSAHAPVPGPPSLSRKSSLQSPSPSSATLRRSPHTSPVQPASPDDSAAVLRQRRNMAPTTLGVRSGSTGTSPVRGSSAGSQKPPKSPMQPSLLSLPRAPVGGLETIAAAAATGSNGSDGLPKPPLQKCSSLPLDGDLCRPAQPEGASTWRQSISTPLSTLRRSFTSLAPKPSSTATQVASASSLTTPGSPPSALVSPGSVGLSSSAWLERRMRKMFHPDDVLTSPTTPGDTIGSNTTPFFSKEHWIDFIQTWWPRLVAIILPLVILFQSLFIPMRLAFGSAQELRQAGANFDALQRLDVPLDTIFLIGVLATDYIDFSSMTLRASLRKSGPHRASVMVQLACDLLSALPWSLLASLVGIDVLSLWEDPSMATPVRVSALVRLPCLLRLTRLFQYLDTFENLNLVNSYVQPTAFRLVKLGFLMYLVAHLAGCGYFVLSFMEGLPSDNDWIVPVFIRTQSLGSQYLHATYWGFSAMTGNLESPQTLPEHIFALIVLLIGVSTYATLIGNLSSIIQQMNSKAEDFREKMVSITGLMETYKLPSDVQHRVKSCFQYLFAVETRSGPQEDDSTTPPRAGGETWAVLEYLPAYLRNELLCHINGEIIHKVPLFRGCSDGFMRSLVPLLRPEVVIPGDYIIRTGEIGREMYLVRHGNLEVIAHGVVVATLSDGSYVGEVAVMFEQKRTASVRAITFCDILVLSKDDFDGVLSQYPEVQRSMKMQATMRRNARSLQDKEFRVAEIEKVNNASARQLPGVNTTSTGKSKTTRAAGTPSKPVAASSTRITITPVGSTPRGTPSRGSLSARSPGLKNSEPQSAKSSREKVSIKRHLAKGQNQVETSAIQDVSLGGRDGEGGSADDTTTSVGGERRPVPVNGVDLPFKQTIVPSGDAPPVAGKTSSDADVASSVHRTNSKWKKLRLLTRGQ